MEIKRYLEFGDLDDDSEIEIMIDKSHYAWINKEDAIKVIAHLQEQFKID